MRTLNGQEAVWADSSKKFYNQVECEESFEHDLGALIVLLINYGTDYHTLSNLSL
jgi:hypothetical protein